jgi:protein-disulfide isomerase
MKVYTLYFTLAAFLFSPFLHAQVVRDNSTQTNQAKSGTQTTNNKTATTNNQRPATLSQATDSLKMAVNDFKKSMNSIFGGKKDTIQILVSEVEYDDANLSLLKESLKKTKGGKFVGMQYKSSAAVLEVSFKGNSTELWDQLPADSKKGFKILEANDNNMTLTVRK